MNNWPENVQRQNLCFVDMFFLIEYNYSWLGCSPVRYTAVPNLFSTLWVLCEVPMRSRLDYSKIAKIRFLAGGARIHEN